MSYKVYADRRDALGLTDADVSRASGVSTATLSNWKNGNYTPKVDKLIQIAAVVGCRIEELINLRSGELKLDDVKRLDDVICFRTRSWSDW